MTTEQLLENEHLTRFNTGVQVFGRMFTRWMDNNKWSHPTMTSLAKASMGGVSWLHSSQISGLRRGQLISPGPRSFVAIKVLNDAIYEYVTQKKLISGTGSSNDYANAVPILEDGCPPELGWWFEVFAGIRTPKDFVYEYDENEITPEKSEVMSKNLARLFRRLMWDLNYDAVEDLSAVIRKFYVVRDRDRVDKFTAVMQGQAAWSPSELLNERPALAQFSKGLGGPSTEESLFEVAK